jgi:hypothetical protein
LAALGEAGRSDRHDAYAQAVGPIEQIYSLSLELRQQQWQVISQSCRTCALCGLGQPGPARERLCQALHAALTIKHHPSLVFVLPAAALLSAHEGRIELAVELYAVATRYPLVANSRWFEDVVGKHVAAAAKSLPPDDFAAAQERGRARDLWKTAEKLLAELAD